MTQTGFQQGSSVGGHSPRITFWSTRCSRSGVPQWRVACFSISGELVMLYRSPCSTASCT